MEQEFATCRSHPKTVEINRCLYMELPFHFLSPSSFAQMACTLPSSPKHVPSVILHPLLTHTFVHTPFFLTPLDLILQSTADLYTIVKIILTAEYF